MEKYKRFLNQEFTSVKMIPVEIRLLLSSFCILEVPAQGQRLAIVDSQDASDQSGRLMASVIKPLHRIPLPFLGGICPRLRLGFALGIDATKNDDVYIVSTEIYFAILILRL